MIALQDIKEGEVLSICYLEAKHALASVPYRCGLSPKSLCACHTLPGMRVTGW